MMENLIICESERFGNIRVLVENGTPLLCGSDVTAILGYQNSRKALARINATRQKRPLPTDGGIQYMTVLNTPDFLRLISRCHTPEARAFESWAKKELLPALEFFAYMAEDESEDCSIQMHTGIFGVSREDLESVRETMPPAKAETEPERDQQFTEGPDNTFAIYQLRRDQGLADYRFASLAELQHDRLSVDRQNYELVYTAPLTPGQSQEETLDKLYERFNLNHPADFTGHSLSVSDIVALRQNGEVSCHYVDSFGFSELPSFLKPENYLKNAEMSMEDDYDSIDSIINNGPRQSTVAELEQQAKTGQPISLMDLAAAAHREEQQEKKKSVLEQLKGCDTKEPPAKTALKKSAEREI